MTRRALRRTSIRRNITSKPTRDIPWELVSGRQSFYRPPLYQLARTPGCSRRYNGPLEDPITAKDRNETGQCVDERGRSLQRRISRHSDHPVQADQERDDEADDRHLAHLDAEVERP